ncbi:MAG: hypothetical protein HZC28_05445 [Spirochaetes bacterium]|nr:hypothetical protein [Spirochaetota bacterium]
MKKTGVLIIISVALAAGMFGSISESFSFLDIAAGGAAASLGTASTAAPGDPDGSFNNPASLASLRGISLTASYDPYLIMTAWNGAAAYAFEGVGTLSVAGHGLVFEPFAGDITFDGDPGRMVSAGCYAACIGIGVPVGKLLKLPLAVDMGAAIKYAAESLDDLSLSALMFDAGCIATISNIIIRDTLSIGFAVKNAGMPLVTASQRITLPLRIAGGFEYGMDVTKNVSYRLRSDIRVDTDGALIIAAGFETSFIKMLAVRYGYMIGADARGPTFGAGIAFGPPAMRLRIDYALIPLGNMGMHHSMQLSTAIADLDMKKAAPEPIDNRNEDLMRRGIGAAKNGDYPAALLYWRQIEKKSASYERALQNIRKAELRIIALADELIVQHEYAKAYAFLSSITDSSPLYSSAKERLKKLRIKYRAP